MILPPPQHTHTLTYTLPKGGGIKRGGGLFQQEEDSRLSQTNGGAAILPSASSPFELLKDNTPPPNAPTSCQEKGSAQGPKASSGQGLVMGAKRGGTKAEVGPDRLGHKTPNADSGRGGRPPVPPLLMGQLRLPSEVGGADPTIQDFIGRPPPPFQQETEPTHKSFCIYTALRV